MFVVQLEKIVLITQILSGIFFSMRLPEEAHNSILLYQMACFATLWNLPCMVTELEKYV